MSALEWLRSEQWSMGNGQCPDCYGVDKQWLGHPNHPTADTIGHKADCPRALAMLELGGIVLIQPSRLVSRRPLLDSTSVKPDGAPCTKCGRVPSDEIERYADGTVIIALACDKCGMLLRRTHIGSDHPQTGVKE